ncbi:MAG: hypothetical protein IKT02_04580, partial [Bacteroidales bacterium]|nr:hypothetical protein [Bacteroidales bacterium]
MRTMRFYTLLVLLLMAEGVTMQAQEFQRRASMRDPLFLDTTSVVFHEIYDFWQRYEYAYFLDYGKISDPNYKPTNYAFWADFEIEDYGNPNS